MNLLEEIETMRKRIEEGEIPSSDAWLDFADKLNLLRGDWDDKLFFWGQEINKMQEEYEKEISHAKALTKVKASDKFREYKELEGVLKRVDESVRLAKIRARNAQSEYFGNYFGNR